MKTLFLSLIAIASSFAQGNCNVSGQFLTSGRGQVFDNRSLKCDLWTMIAQNNNGFSALSIEIDGAPDNQGVPGMWFAVSAIPPTSAPCTDINTCYIIAKVAYPWMSVNVTSVMGTGIISYRLSGTNTMFNNVFAAATGTFSATPPFLANSTGTSFFGPLFQLTPPPLTGWTNINTATFDTNNGYPYVSGPRAGAAQIKGIRRPPPTAPFSVVLLLYNDWSGQQAASCGECMLAVGFSDGTNYTTMMLGITSTAFGVLATHWTNATTFGANVKSTTGTSFTGLIMKNPIWLKLCDDGTTNIQFFWSIDGQHFVQFYSEARLSFLASVSGVFVGTYPNAGVVETALFNYSTTNSCP